MNCIYMQVYTISVVVIQALSVFLVQGRSGSPPVRSDSVASSSWTWDSASASPRTPGPSTSLTASCATLFPREMGLQKGQVRAFCWKMTASSSSFKTPAAERCPLKEIRLVWWSLCQVRACPCCDVCL